MSKTLQVKVQNPRQILFNGEALSVSSADRKGKFDILPEHANFIALIDKKPIEIVQTNKEKITFNVNTAIVLNRNNIVTVFVDPQGIAL